MVKHRRKTLPQGHSARDFIYQGRPAKDQGDFGSGVGLVDMCCVNQFGDANNDKYYHAGVCKTPDGKWWLYTEWGRRSPGKSWDGGMPRTDFQFEEFSDEVLARKAFAKKAKSKNTSRIVEKSPGVWVAKNGKDGYLVQDLATREKGLPDAYHIKEVPQTKPKKKKAKTKAPLKSYHPEELSLANALIGGTANYTKRATQASGGVIPTLSTISNVRDNLIPEALVEISRVSRQVKKRHTEDSGAYEHRLALACIQDHNLQDLSRMVAALIPLPIPRHGGKEERALATILSNNNIQRILDDLDAFESSLMNEEFSFEEDSPSLDIEKALNSSIQFVDPSSDEGKWVLERFEKQTKNRHYGYNGIRIKNIFAISRPRVDSSFIKSAKLLHKKRKNEEDLDKADMQPSALSEDLCKYPNANVAWQFHGTRSVNVAPILQTDLRLPKSLKGVHLTGAAFGHGIYFAVDYKKSLGYSSCSNAYYAGDGGIQGRGAFLFFGEVLLGKPYRATQAWTISDCPRGYDSVFASGKWCPTLANDEHVIWGTREGPSHRLRYLLEVG